MPPTLFYDSHCSFCRRWIQRWRNITGDAIDYQPFPENENPPSVRLLESDGSELRAAAAVFRSLDLSGHYRWLNWSYHHVPGFAPISEFFYRLIARHRNAADRLDLFLIGPQTQPATHAFTRQIFLRGLAIIYAIAFLSLWVQVDGLIGSSGILPVRSFLDNVAHQVGPQRFWYLPTLCWLNASDAMLHLLCAAGVLSAALVVFGILQLPGLIVSWTCYLSLSVAAQLFLAFQWDILLLEAGFLAIFLAPWQLWPSRINRLAPAPSRTVLWLCRWLAFRVVFISGVVKLASHDPAWHAWTALAYHYETQPLPTWTAWYLFQLPAWFHSFSCGLVFFSELIVPLFIFFPRRIRIAAMWLMIAFQFLILATGNFGFFNLLTIVLCFTLADDTHWRAVFRRPQKPPAAKPSRWCWPGWITVPLALFLLGVTLPQFIAAFNISVTLPAPFPALQRYAEPLRIANSYGLFAVMTTTRHEIVLEGSDDGIHWLPYHFKYKPDELNQRPRFTTPHMPRLDWQLWFAPLGDPESNNALLQLMRCLLQGSVPVIDLMKSNPFPSHPPQHIRALLYDYHFTNFAERRASGAWWTRQPLGLYAELSQSDLRPQIAN